MLLFLVVGSGPTQAQDTTTRPLRWSGDLRLRGEWDVDRAPAPDRARARIRFRIGVEKEVRSHLVAGARVATVPERRDPNSTHQTLGNGFQTFAIALDRAFVRWTPNGRSPIAVRAGKFGHPFADAPIFGELVWDADIQPEGVAVVAGPYRGVRLVAAEYLVLHRSPGKTVGLTTGQVAWQAAWRRLVPSVAAGVYAYQRPDAEGARFLARENQGNALLFDAAGDTTGFASRFVILHLQAALEYRAGGTGIPLQVGGQYVRNVRAAAAMDEDGFAAGVQAGRLGTPGSWRAYYQYQELGREALFSPFAQDDFLQSVNLRAHLAGAYLQIIRGGTLHAWMLWSANEVPRAGTFQKRFRLDLNLTL